MNSKLKWFLIQFFAFIIISTYLAPIVQFWVYGITRNPTLGYYSAWFVKVLWLIWCIKSGFAVFKGAKPVLERDAENKIIRWKFVHSKLTVIADFNLQTVHIKAGKSVITDRRIDKDAKGKKSSVDLVIPMLDLRYTQEPVKAWKTYTTYTSATGTGTAYVNGQAVTVTTNTSVPTGGGGYEETIAQKMIFVSPKITRKIYAVSDPVRKLDGSITSHNKVAYSNSPNNLTIELPKVEIHLNRSFASSWNAVMSQIKEIGDALDKKLLAEASLADVEKLALLEVAKRDQAAKEQKLKDSIKQIAEAEVLKTLNEANMADCPHYCSWNSATGALNFLLAHDKLGNLLVREGEYAWHGPASGATAKNVGTEDAQWVEIEVRDRAYELEFLKKRRFNVLHGFEREKQLEWIDKVNILGEH